MQGSRKQFEASSSRLCRVNFHSTLFTFVKWTVQSELIYYGCESGWKSKSPKTGGMLSKPIHLSETEESGILCVGVKSRDLRRNAKGEQ
jgi:hypothetical protein